MAPADLQSHFPFFEGQSYLIIIMEAVNFIVDLAYLFFLFWGIWRILNCVWHWLKKLVFILFYYITYFYYYLYVTLYFWRYLWVLLYYFNYSLALFTVLSRKNFQFQLNKLFLNRHLRVWLNSSTFLIGHIHYKKNVY